MANIIDGKAIAATIRGEVAAEAAQLKEKGGHAGLAVILVGEDPASCTYVRNKQKACIEAGLYAEQINMPADTTQEQLLAKVDELNRRTDIHGILCQLPLPRHLDDKAVIAAISPDKDVDAFHASNVARMRGSELAICSPSAFA